MSASLIEIKKKTGIHPKDQYKLMFKQRKAQREEELLNLNRDKFQPDSPSLLSGRELTFKTLGLGVKANRAEKEKGYQSSDNLKLGDYLRLTSLSKRAEGSKVHQRIQNRSLEPTKNMIKSLPIGQNTRTIINTSKSIQVVREETKKQLGLVHKKLLVFLEQLSNKTQFGNNEESLVFMCQVLHIFEENIVQASKYAQKLIQDHKKKKDIHDLKIFAKRSTSPLKRKKQKSKINNTSISNIQDSIMPN